MPTTQTMGHLHCNTQITIGTNSSNKVSVNSGIGQGYSLSSVLFKKIMDKTLSELRKELEYKIGNTYDPEIGYADDAGLMTESTDSLKSSLHKLNTTEKNLNLSSTQKMVKVWHSVRTQ